MKELRSILITGGTSGIGEGLLHAWARPGIVLAFNGRDEKRIAEVKSSLEKKGATVYSSNVDVRDAKGMEEWIKSIDDQSPLDLVIANAGTATPQEPGLSWDERAKATFDVNIYGVFNTIHPALERMIPRKHGQIALLSSIAGFIGLGHSPAYSASKNAVKAYGRALRTRLAPDGIGVSVICPGVVPTRMTAQFYEKFPGTVPLDRAVKII
ncbi:MAG: SDR family NAD(P)-dependent oxidoreductase, partial [bacterium]